MHRLMMKAMLGALVLALAVAASAVASGGSGSGGGGGGGGGGGSTSSGGTNSGGVKDVAPARAVPCANLVNVSDPVGHYLTWAAAWHNSTVNSCSANVQTLTITVEDRNTATGQVEFSYSGTYSVASNGKVQNMIDNDFAPFDVNYDIVTTVTDAARHDGAAPRTRPASVGHADELEDPREMSLHRLLADPERAGDVLVRLALRDEGEHGPLALAELGLGAALDPCLQDGAGGARVQRRLAVGRRPDALQQLGRPTRGISRSITTTSGARS
jgi:hypothetical protein